MRIAHARLLRTFAKSFASRKACSPPLTIRPPKLYAAIPRERHLSWCRSRGSENMQRRSPSEYGVDEWRHRATLGQDQQAAEQTEQHQQRQQPIFLSGPGESE